MFGLGYHDLGVFPECFIGGLGVGVGCRCFINLCLGHCGISIALVIHSFDLFVCRRGGHRNCCQSRW